MVLATLSGVTVLSALAYPTTVLVYFGVVSERLRERERGGEGGGGGRERWVEGERERGTGR